MTLAWDDEQCRMLRSLVAMAWSGTEIARELSRHYHVEVSRNAVIGKLHRLKIERPTAREPRPRVRRVRVPTLPRAQLVLIARPLATAPPPAEPPPDRRCTLLELTNETCRWPVARDPFLFCGQPTADLAAGIPYCPYHTRMARGVRKVPQ